MLRYPGTYSVRQNQEKGICHRIGTEPVSDECPVLPMYMYAQPGDTKYNININIKDKK